MLRRFVLPAILLLAPHAVRADAGIEFYEKKIRPVLAANCYSCHSAEAEKLRAGLMLDTRGAILKGGDHGPAVAPGKPDADLPDHDEATMKRLFARPMPDWADREAVAAFAAAGAEILGDDPVAARATAARIWDRTPGTAPPVQMANQLGMVFAKLDCKPRWRKRLPEIAVPTLVVHGRRDPFFPVGNGEAIAREIPGARLLVLEEAATAIPDAAAGEVAEAMLTLG